MIIYGSGSVVSGQALDTGMYLVGGIAYAFIYCHISLDACNPTGNIPMFGPLCGCLILRLYILKIMEIWSQRFLAVVGVELS